MKFIAPLLLSTLVFISCTSNPSHKKQQEVKINHIRINRYSVKNGNPDSITLSNYIVRTFDGKGQEMKSIYHATDHSIMMQFVNHYENDVKSRIDWINGSDELVKYVKNTYDENERLIRSESFSPEHEFQSGFIHQWSDDGKVERKGPISQEKPFQANAVYTYNESHDFMLLEEFDDQDQLYAVVRWLYKNVDEQGNWTERHMVTNDTLNQVEKRIISYQ